MKLISIPSIILLLSASTALACEDVDGYFRQGSRQLSLIDQHLINGNTETQCRLFCFPADGALLKSAVNSYINEGCELTNTSCATRTQYGAIGSWCVKDITDMNYLFSVSGNDMFSGASSFNSDISRWDVSSVTTMAYMFQYASSFNSDISKWDVSRVTYMQGTFYVASSFNSDISNWDVGSVTVLLDMFLGASSFNSDVSYWDVGRVTNMYSMFRGASSFNSDISRWDVSSVTDMRSMFQGASSFYQNLCPWGSKLPSNFNYVSQPTNWLTNMFSLSGCANKTKPTGPTGPWCDVTKCIATVCYTIEGI